MNTMKSLGLAAVTVLSLGCAAMAQQGASPMPTDYWAIKWIAGQQRTVDGSQIQSGSSDVGTLHGGVQTQSDFGDLANPG
jgi:hypothetical protein